MPTVTLCKSRSAACAKVQAAVIVVGMVAGFAGLAFVAPDQLDRLPRLCLWSYMLGGPCPACGTLHALCWAAHGDLARACDCNRNVLLLVPAFAWVWLGQIRVLCRANAELGRVPGRDSRLNCC